MRTLVWDDPEFSWGVYLLLEAWKRTGWDHLPYSGGILDQPSGLLKDLLQWKYLVDLAERQIQDATE